MSCARPKRILKHVASLVGNHGGSHGGSRGGSHGGVFGRKLSREFGREFGWEFGREFGIKPWRVLSIDLVSMCYEACMKHTWSRHEVGHRVGHGP